MKKNIEIVEKKEGSVFSAIAATAAVLSFIPTVFVKREDGFDAYAILSKLSYRSKINEEGKKRVEISIKLFDLERYGITVGKKADEDSEVAEAAEAAEADETTEITEATEEENEDSSCIEE